MGSNQDGRPDEAPPAADQGGSVGTVLIEDMCAVGFAAFVVGTCLHALAAAIALSLALGMVVMGLTGGSVSWTLVMMGVMLVSVCAVAACRIRRRRLEQDR